MLLRGIGFCPGHITGFFSIHDGDKNPLKNGSRGAGVALNNGVMVNTVLTPDAHPKKEGLDLDLNVKGPGEFKVEERLYRQVLTELLPGKGKGWKVKLRATLQLPVGQGFGMSGAAALATSVSVWEALYSKIPAWDRKLRYRAQQEKLFSLTTPPFKVRPVMRRLTNPMEAFLDTSREVVPPPSSGKASGMVENGGGIKEASPWLMESRAEKERGHITFGDCVKAAHRADLETGGGLGDVVAQARGGMTVRLAPGVPPFGEVHTLPVQLDSVPKVIAVIVGDPISTPDFLRNRAKRKMINDVGELCLSSLLMIPTMENLMEESHNFYRGTSLSGLDVKGAVSAFGDIGISSMSMVGNSVFSLLPPPVYAEKQKEIEKAWGDRGELITCDVDLLGAHPVN